MSVLKTLCIGLIVVMVVAGGVLPETAEKVRIIDGIGKGIFVSFGLVLLGYIIGFLRRGGATAEVEAPTKQKAKKKARPKVEISGQSVIVDGANVMNWGGNPSTKVLSNVLKELQHRGMEPVVYFDADVGRELMGKRVKPAALAAELGLAAERVIFAPKLVPADEYLLEQAMNDGLRVVTNDKYVDWKEKFPKVGEAGFLIKGMWKEGAVILLGLGRQSAAT